MTEVKMPDRIQHKKVAAKSTKKIFEELKAEWDFNELIAPYKEGGTQDHPVERSWGSMIDWLMNKRKFPIDVVGAGIFLTWVEIKRNGHFVGDGTYGSAGDEFAKFVLQVCANIMQQRMSQEIFTGAAGAIAQRIQLAFVADFWSLQPFWVKIFSWKFYKYKFSKHGRK